MSLWRVFLSKPTRIVFLALIIVIPFCDCLKRCAIVDNTPDPVFHLIKPCSRSKMTLVGSANTKTLQQCQRYASNKRALALNYNPSGNFMEEPSCLLFDCPEFEEEISLAEDDIYDYYSLYADPLPDSNISCVPKVGMFKLHKEKVNYTAAQDICEEEGGYLADVVTEQKTNALSGLLSSMYSGRGKHSVFVGLNDMDMEGFYVNFKDEPLDCFNWRAWAPNQPRSKHNTEDCVVLTTDKNWKVVNCTLQMPFLCELTPRGPRNLCEVEPAYCEFGETPVPVFPEPSAPPDENGETEFPDIIEIPVPGFSLENSTGVDSIDVQNISQNLDKQKNTKDKPVKSANGEDPSVNRTEVLPNKFEENGNVNNNGQTQAPDDDTNNFQPIATDEQFALNPDEENKNGRNPITWNIPKKSETLEKLKPQNNKNPIEINTKPFNSNKLKPNFDDQNQSKPNPEEGIQGEISQNISTHNKQPNNKTLWRPYIELDNSQNPDGRPQIPIFTFNQKNGSIDQNLWRPQIENQTTHTRPQQEIFGHLRPTIGNEHNLWQPHGGLHVDTTDSSSERLPQRTSPRYPEEPNDFRLQKENGWKPQEEDGNQIKYPQQQNKWTLQNEDGDFYNQNNYPQEQNSWRPQNEDADLENQNNYPQEQNSWRPQSEDGDLYNQNNYPQEQNSWRPQNEDADLENQNNYPQEQNSWRPQNEDADLENQNNYPQEQNSWRPQSADGDLYNQNNYPQEQNSWIPQNENVDLQNQNNYPQKQNSWRPQSADGDLYNQNNYHQEQNSWRPQNFEISDYTNTMWPLNNEESDVLNNKWPPYGIPNNQRHSNISKLDYEDSKKKPEVSIFKNLGDELINDEGHYSNERQFLLSPDMEGNIRSGQKYQSKKLETQNRNYYINSEDRNEFHSNEWTPMQMENYSLFLDKSSNSWKPLALSRFNYKESGHWVTLNNKSNNFNINPWRPVIKTRGQYFKECNLHEWKPFDVNMYNQTYQHEKNNTTKNDVLNIVKEKEYNESSNLRSNFGNHIIALVSDNKKDQTENSEKYLRKNGKSGQNSDSDISNRKMYNTLIEQLNMNDNSMKTKIKIEDYLKNKDENKMHILNFEKDDSIKSLEDSSHKFQQNLNFTLESSGLIKTNSSAHDNIVEGKTSKVYTNFIISTFMFNPDNVNDLMFEESKKVKNQIKSNNETLIRDDNIIIQHNKTNEEERKPIAIKIRDSNTKQCRAVTFTPNNRSK